MRQPAACEHSPPKGLRHHSRMLNSDSTGIRQPMPIDTLAADPLSRSKTTILARDENSLGFPLEFPPWLISTRILALPFILDKFPFPGILPFFTQAVVCSSRALILAWRSHSRFQPELRRVAEVAVSKAVYEAEAGNPLETPRIAGNAGHLDDSVESQLGNLYADSIKREET